MNTQNTHDTDAMHLNETTLYSASTQDSDEFRRLP